VTGIHAEAHGQIPNDVVEEEQTDVLSFMGRIADIPPGEQLDDRAIDRAMRSIMFTDLVGYTAMTNRLGDDRAVKVLRDHNTVVRDALAKYGGREVKHTGDGVMASFDVADQALRAAVDIRSGVVEIAVPDEDTNLNIRIGLTSGEPLEEGGDLFGSVVNLASRICDLAEPGEILFSDVFQRELTDDGFAIDSIGDITIRGFDQPVRVGRFAG
jgi:class 3 adenylate cyclase